MVFVNVKFVFQIALNMYVFTLISILSKAIDRQLFHNDLLKFRIWFISAKAASDIPLALSLLKNKNIRKHKNVIKREILHVKNVLLWLIMYVLLDRAEFGVGRLSMHLSSVNADRSITVSASLIDLDRFYKTNI